MTYMMIWIAKSLLTILRDEKMAFVCYPNVAQGYNLRTILEVVLKITQRESAVQMIICMQFRQNLRCRVLWLGRSVMECPGFKYYPPRSRDFSWGHRRSAKEGCDQPRGKSGEGRGRVGGLRKVHVGPVLTLANITHENRLSEVGFEPTPGEPDCDLNAAP